MKKHLFQKSLLVLIGVLITSLTTNVWAYNETYIVGDLLHDKGDNKWTDTSFPIGTQNASGTGSTYMYIANGNYFKVRINSKPAGNNDSWDMTTNGTGSTFYKWDNNDPAAAHYTGYSGIVKFNCTSTTSDNPVINLTRPDVYIRHNWGNNGWSNKKMTDNNDGTYTLVDYYSGTKRAHVGPEASSKETPDASFKDFDADGDNEIHLIGSPTTGSKCLFTFDSYWYRAAGQGSTGYVGALTIAKIYVVTFDLQGKGDNFTQDVVCNAENNQTTSQPSNPTATGWAFGGWYTDAGCTISANFSTAITANTTIYAKWTENKSSISIFAGDHGTLTTPASVSNPYSLGVATKQAITAKADVGYYFTSWSCTGTAAVDNASSISTNAKTNGTNGSSGTITAQYARTYAFIEGRFHVTNSSRNGTWTNTFGNGDWDASSTRIPFTYDGTNKRFYLHTYATPNELTTQISSANPVFYVKTSTASGSITGETNYKAPSANTYLSEAGTKVALSDHSEGTTNDANLRFNSSDNSGYAVIYFDESDIWYQLEQTLAYNANGGTGSKTTTWHMKGSTTTAPAANTFSRTGYTFSGWKTGASSGTSYAAGASVTMNSNITLYAQWTINNHTITRTAPTNGNYTIKVGDAEAVSTTTTSDYNKTITLTATANTGYHFTGWAVSKAGGGSITPSSSATANPATFSMPDDDVTVSASFAPDVYTITYKDQGNVAFSGSHVNTPSTHPTSHTYGTATTLNSATKTGYTFGGWYTNSSCTGDAVTSLGATAYTANITLYAKWTANTYAVTFDYSTNGGSKTSGNDQNNATYDQNTISVPTVKKDGYCFNGWYTAASDGVLVIDAEGNLQNSVSSGGTWTDATGKWKKTSTATVYAQFSIPEVTLTKSGKGLISSMPGYDTVVINYTFSGCTPTGNYNVADTVGYAVNHAHLAPQPTIKYGTGSGVGHDTIIMPVADGTNYYEVVATLRTGSIRGAGTVIRRDTIRADVESSYLVKIRYQVDGIDIQPEKGWYLYPSFRAMGVNIPKVLNGYELDSCRYGVGVTLDHEADELEGYTTKYCYTENASTITAVYKPKANTVYFMDAFGKYWYSTKMKIYDYGTSNSYWASNVYGAKSTGLTGDTIEVAKSGTPEIMMASISASTTNFAITNKRMDNYDRFHGSSTNNEWARVIYRTDFNAATPMFVPVSSKPDPLADGDFYVLNEMDGGAAHYYRGFWVKYSPNIDSTGYVLKVYDGPSSSTLIQSIPLRLTPTGEGNSYELTATLDLEGGKTYGFQFTKATGVSTVATYGKTSTTLESDSPSAVGLTSGGSKCGLTTTSAGDYTFHVYCANFGAKDANTASATDVQGQWGVKVDFATQANDYRVYYADATQTEPIMSQTIHNRSNGLDTVSFFVRKNSASRVMKFQKFNGSTSAWDDVASGSVDLSGITKDSIYVFYVAQNEGATTISVTGRDFYDGDFYIRTDCVDDHKWDYKQSLDNHKMSESDYGMASIQPFKFSHYYVHWCTANSNVKYVVATKYSPCLTDTVITDTWVTDGGGKLGSKGANIRFMYNKSTNATQRAYLYGSEENDDNYLKLREKPDNNKMQDTNGTTINDIKFTDEKNWIYTADIKAVPGLQAQLTADYLGQRQYFLGNADSGEEILGGTTGEAQSIDLTYDFKTNRLVCAWRPSNDSIKAEIPINADVLIIRKAQGNAEQLRFNNDGKLSDVKYAYGVIQFDYNDMYHSMYRWDYWSYMHCMYYISFPYDVLVSDIMGVGQLGVDWRLQRYNGAKRAKDGWYAGDGVTTFWEDLQPGDTLHAYEGYSLLLNRNRFNGTVGNIWDNKVAGSSVYLYFPSATATTGIVQNKSVTIHVPEHECTIDKPFQQDPSKNHKIVDSHWNMIGTPLFEDKTAVTVTPTDLPDGTTLNYVYAWNYFSNTLMIAATLNTGFEFKTMYGYMAQFAGDITFSGSAVNRIVASERSDEKKNYRLNLELTKEDQFVGRTYVELNENAVDSFALNEDVCMLKNGVTADLYTFSGAYEAGANVMTIGNHVIPVGVDVKTAGMYTFSMPDNFDGTVTLLDTYTQTRTNLSLDVYEIYLEQGTIEGRFFIELNIQETITSIENVDGNNGINDGGVHKFIKNDNIYILKNGVIYDARGARVQ